MPRQAGSPQERGEDPRPAHRVGRPEEAESALSPDYADIEHQSVLVVGVSRSGTESAAVAAGRDNELSLLSPGAPDRHHRNPVTRRDVAQVGLAIDPVARTHRGVVGERLMVDTRGERGVAEEGKQPVLWCGEPVHVGRIVPPAAMASDSASSAHIRYARSGNQADRGPPCGPRSRAIWSRPCPVAASRAPAGTSVAFSSAIGISAARIPRATAGSVAEASRGGRPTPRKRITEYNGVLLGFGQRPMLPNGAGVEPAREVD